MGRFSLLLAVGIFLTASLSSQTYIFDKGSMQIGGSLGLNSFGGSTFIHVSPQAGFFLQRNLEVGGSLSIGSSGGNSNVFLGPYGRYYFTDGKLLLTPYAGVALGINSGGGGTNLSMHIHGGLAYVIAKNVTINSQLDIGIGNSTSFGLNVGLGVYLW